MPEIKVERLSLLLSGLSEDQGRHLARSIADGLAAANMPEAAADSDSMKSSVTARAGSSMPDLADQVVADLVQQLNRLM